MRDLTYSGSAILVHSHCSRHHQTVLIGKDVTRWVTSFLIPDQNGSGDCPPLSNQSPDLDPFF